MVSQSFDCDSIRSTEKELQRFRDYWTARDNGKEIPDALEDELNGGWITFYCENSRCGEVEINNEETLSQYLKETWYSLTVKPDLTLEQL